MAEATALSFAATAQLFDPGKQDVEDVVGLRPTSCGQSAAMGIGIGRYFFLGDLEGQGG